MSQIGDELLKHCIMQKDPRQLKIRVGEDARGVGVGYHLCGDVGREFDSPNRWSQGFAAAEPHTASSKCTGIAKANIVGVMLNQLTDVCWAS
jgi:hypothetical protein